MLTTSTAVIFSTILFLKFLYVGYHVYYNMRKPHIKHCVSELDQLTNETQSCNSTGI